MKARIMYIFFTSTHPVVILGSGSTHEVGNRVLINLGVLVG